MSLEVPAAWRVTAPISGAQEQAMGFLARRAAPPEMEIESGVGISFQQT